MKTISKLSDLKKLFIQFLKDSKLKEYIIYGSFAYSYYSGEDINLNDIDIIASKKNFDKIKKALDNNPNWKAYEWEKGLHINSTKYLGIDGKPFDISIDSFEDYFEPTGIKIDDYIFMDKKDKIKIISPETIIRSYFNIPQDNKEKKDKYESRLNKLKSLIRK